ncbi:hypothetical protein WJX81_008146 [Elliptochloris bilobata]|uniref:Uncharacterized protein n=1 Tax=Elliptochloris bilobata TaxID=381761 RepID=A0AAW1QLZ0_9CHLO
MSTSAAAPAPPKDDEEQEIGDECEALHFERCAYEHLEIQGLRPHPDACSEAASLAAVALPSVNYRMGIPRDVAVNGVSALQYQAALLACAKHETMLPSGERAGFYLGDSPGVGKGRIIAAVVFENILRKRPKAVWFSVSADLAPDATRDFRDLGALDFDGVDILDLRRMKVKNTQRLSDLPGLDRGVLFCTYSLLTGGSVPTAKLKASLPRFERTMNAGDVEAYKGTAEFVADSRLQQIVDWCGGAEFDGCLVFDECHKAKNCTVTVNEKSGFAQSESKTARAVVELQRRLPLARILYVSATGATDANNLCYMTRLGLWGAHTAFPTKQEFVYMLTKRGVSAMELVAMELKRSGQFIARTLSYEGVVFTNEHVSVSEDFETMYDASCALWSRIVDACEGENLGKAGRLHLWGAQLRFYRQLTTAAKVQRVIELAREALAAGGCVVIGMQGTGEARTKALVGDSGGDDAVFEALAEPAGLLMVNVIEKHVPEHLSIHRELLRDARALRLPQNPLDQVIEALGGVKAVAELSGRHKRMVRNADGTYSYVARSQDCPLDQVNMAEKHAFQSGRKLVAVISDAASTGISLQADRKCANTRPRTHITLELAWSADKTVQQLGRTHRSNQLQPPKYVILSSNIAGEHRFASAVAQRLSQLGALTQGDRHASSAADALAPFNLQTKQAQQALRRMYRILLRRESLPKSVTPAFIADALPAIPEGGSDHEYRRERARAYLQFIADARNALEQVRVLDTVADFGDELNKIAHRQQQRDEDGLMQSKKGPGGNISKLLNRLLGVPVKLQANIFAFFMALQDAEIREAKRLGTFEQSAISKPAGVLRLVKEEVVLRDAASGLETCIVHFDIDRGVTYEAALEQLRREQEADPQTFSGFYKNVNSANGVLSFVLAIERDAHGRKLRRSKGRRPQPAYYRLIRPATGFSPTDMNAKEFGDKYKLIAHEKEESKWMRQRWTSEFNSDSKKLRKQPLYLVTGSVVPILPTIDKAFQATGVGAVPLQARKLHVMRVEAEGGVVRIGIRAHQRLVPGLRAALQREQELRNARAAVIGAAAGPAPAGPVQQLLQPLQPLSGGGNLLDAQAPPSSDVAVANLKENWDPEAMDAGGSGKGAARHPYAPRRAYRKRRSTRDGADAGPSRGAAEDAEEAEDEARLRAQCAARLGSSTIWEDIKLPPCKQVAAPPKQERKPAASPSAKPGRQQRRAAVDNYADMSESDDCEDASDDAIAAAGASAERGSDGEGGSGSDGEEWLRAARSNQLASLGGTSPPGTDTAAGGPASPERPQRRTLLRRRSSAASAAGGGDAEDADESGGESAGRQAGRRLLAGSDDDEDGIGSKEEAPATGKAAKRQPAGKAAKEPSGGDESAEEGDNSDGDDEQVPAKRTGAKLAGKRAKKAARGTAAQAAASVPASPDSLVLQGRQAVEGSEVSGADSAAAGADEADAPMSEPRGSGACKAAKAKAAAAAMPPAKRRAHVSAAQEGPKAKRGKEAAAAAAALAKAPGKADKRRAAAEAAAAAGTDDGDVPCKGTLVKRRRASAAERLASEQRDAEEPGSALGVREAEARFAAALLHERAEFAKQVRAARKEAEAAAEARFAALEEARREEKKTAMRKAMELGIKRGTDAATKERVEARERFARQALQASVDSANEREQRARQEAAAAVQAAKQQAEASAALAAKAAALQGQLDTLEAAAADKWCAEAAEEERAVAAAAAKRWAAERACMLSQLEQMRAAAPPATPFARSAGNGDAGAGDCHEASMGASPAAPTSAGVSVTRSALRTATTAPSSCLKRIRFQLLDSTPAKAASVECPSAKGNYIAADTTAAKPATPGASAIEGLSAGAMLAWLEKQTGEVTLDEIVAGLGAASADALAAPLQALHDGYEIYVRKGRYAVL